MAGGIIHSSRGVGGGKFSRRRHVPMSDINVTPMVDVMLVLLVIFMITAPLLQVGVPLNSKDEVFLGDTKFELAELGNKLKAVHDEKPDQRVFIRGDKSIQYGRMMEVMGVVIDSGFRQLGLLGEQADGKPAAAPAKK